MIPHEKSALNLLLRGSLTVAQIEANGIRVDVDYLEKAIISTTRKIKELESELQNSEIVQVWKSVYKDKYNFQSGPQLGHVLFEKMGFESDAKTPTGKYKVDEKTLASIKHPFIDKYFQIKKLNKMKVTYLGGIKREVHNGFLHPSFRLNSVRTFRSSGDSPNFQNLPNRDPDQMKLIRKCFVPRDGRRIVGVDYGGIEVRISACYHKDPKLIKYLKDPNSDMHKDWAAECFLLKPSKVNKAIRYLGKNQFVFPEFYGSWWIDCAANMWQSAEETKLDSGITLKEHLKSLGIYKLGQQIRKRPQTRPGEFEHHIKSVETKMWREFAVYAQWKKDWYESYQKRGWIKTLTGFVMQTYMRRNDAINYPVQGAAFHCLLQSLIWLQDELNKRKMKTLIVGQIHDEIVADVPEDELHDYLGLCKEIMVERLSREWEWIIVPLEVAADTTELNGNWSEKTEIKI